MERHLRNHRNGHTYVPLILTLGIRECRSRGGQVELQFSESEILFGRIEREHDFQRTFLAARLTRAPLQLNVVRFVGARSGLYGGVARDVVQHVTGYVC